MGNRFCPNCSGEETEELENGIMACTNCGFEGSVFPEKELIGEVGLLDEDIEEDMPVKTIRMKNSEVKLRTSSKANKTKAKKGRKK